MLCHFWSRWGFCDARDLSDALHPAEVDDADGTESDGGDGDWFPIRTAGQSWLVAGDGLVVRGECVPVCVRALCVRRMERLFADVI